MSDDFPIQSKQNVVYRVGVILWEVENPETDQHEAEILEEEYLGGDFADYKDALVLWTAVKDDEELVAAVRQRIKEAKQ